MEAHEHREKDLELLLEEPADAGSHPQIRILPREILMTRLFFGGSMPYSVYNIYQAASGSHVAGGVDLRTV
jgi:hypothetical protein